MDKLEQIYDNGEKKHLILIYNKLKFEYVEMEVISPAFSWGPIKTTILNKNLQAH